MTTPVGPTSAAISGDTIAGTGPPARGPVSAAGSRPATPLAAITRSAAAPSTTSSCAWVRRAAAVVSGAPESTISGTIAVTPGTAASRCVVCGE